MSRELQEKVVELYKIRTGYKKISKVLRIDQQCWKFNQEVENEVLLKPNHGQVDQVKFQPELPEKLKQTLKTHGLAVSTGKSSAAWWPEESHYYANATKYPTYNTPNSTETSLKPSGTKSFGVMRPKLNFLATTIDSVFGEESLRPMMKGAPFLLWNSEVDRWCFGDMRATKAQEMWSELMARWMQYATNHKWKHVLLFIFPVKMTKKS